MRVFTPNGLTDPVREIPSPTDTPREKRAPTPDRGKKRGALPPRPAGVYRAADRMMARQEGWQGSIMERDGAKSPASSLRHPPRRSGRSPASPCPPGGQAIPTICARLRSMRQRSKRGHFYCGEKGDISIVR